MIQSHLRVAVVQVDLVWNDVEANFQLFERKLDEVDQAVDLYVLPEMFSTGFCMKPMKASPEAGELSLKWLIRQAKQRNAGFCASVLFRREDGSFVNRMFLVDSDGSHVHYDKWHRFAMAGEDKAYATGSRNPVVALFRGWKILLQVCYDLRFPVYSRNQKDGYDLVIYVANWPETRRIHWRTLLLARAIENQSYCIGVNRVGMEKNGLRYVGDSLVVDPQGVPILDMAAKGEIGITEISKIYLNDIRKRLPFLSDADTFRMHD